MAYQAWQLPACASAQFEETINPVWPNMADIAVASLTPISPVEFEGGATPASATWQAVAGETREAFKARILADLIANSTISGITPPGALVQIYSRGAFFERNAIGALLPVVA